LFFPLRIVKFDWCTNYIYFPCFSQLSSKFGADFDKYLIKELIEQIDLKDPNKVSKDKNEAVKSQLLSQELSRCS